ncbi:IS4 family transposase [Colwellia sp. MT41]|nr:IS4 family transposase [Colwellia sp. MT41]
MNTSTMLHTFFKMSSFNAINDKRRIKAVLDCTDSLAMDETLTLTGLGRGIINTKAKVKNSIKRVCRLLGNENLHQERIGVYAAIAKVSLKNIKYPLIIIDWSPVNRLDKQILRAVIPIGGRAFTLYEEVYPEKQLGTVTAHKDFLNKLALVLPKNITPIISTDAGYRVPWFKEVEAQGWFWLGRLRGRVSLQVEEQWQSVYELFSQVKVNEKKHLGTCLLGKTQKHTCTAVLYKKASKGRSTKTLDGKKSRRSVSLEYAKGGREPWLLVSNMPELEWPAERIVNLYNQRMQIEEGFRDTKNERYGLALNFCRSSSLERVNILLMIAMLTQFSLILVGKMAYIKGYYKDFQANTVKSRRVLSYFRLGKELIRREQYQFNVADIALALGGLKACADAQFR